MIFRQLYVLTSCSFSPKFHNDWIKIVNFIYVVFPNSAWTKFGNSCLNLSVRFISRPSFKIRTYSESSQNCRSIAVLYDSEALIQLWIIYIIVVSRNSRHTVYVGICVDVSPRFLQSYLWLALVSNLHGCLIFTVQMDHSGPTKTDIHSEKGSYPQTMWTYFWVFIILSPFVDTFILK